MLLDHSACLAAIDRETTRFADLLAVVDHDAPIAACPGWTVRDVGAHIGEVQRSWAWNVRLGTTERGDRRPELAAPGPDLGRYVRDGAQELLAALDAAGPDAPSWTWWGQPATSGAVARHQVHEVALHRWDVEETGGGDPEPWPDLQAADGIDELLLVTLSVEDASWPGSPAVLVIEPDGVEAAWTVDATGARPALLRGASAAYDLRLSGAAADLQLLLWNRPRSFRYRGDPEVLTAFLAWPDLT